MTGNKIVPSKYLRNLYINPGLNDPSNIAVTDIQGKIVVVDETPFQAVFYKIRDSETVKCTTTVLVTKITTFRFETSGVVYK